ncbi:MAG TPA: AraC family transcriptional regulator [Abditibacterium sp.]|jgi:AraC-like DNA-binding protein
MLSSDNHDSLLESESAARDGRERVFFADLSAPHITPIRREDFGQPLTPIGVHLDSLSGGIAPEWVLHEMGNRIIYPNWNARGVLSPFWRLYSNLESGASVWHEGHEIPLLPGNIYLLAENTRFDCHAHRPTPHLWLHFSVRPAYAFDLSAPHAVPVDGVLEALTGALRAEEWPVLGEKALQRLYFGGMALLHATFARAALSSARALPPHLREVLRKIERCPRENLSNERLARICGLSVNGFTRLFSQHLRVSPAIYVRRARLNTASRLLAFTDLSIEQVAEASGFPNRHYFTRMFVRHAGCGPATFRKSHQNGGLAGETLASETTSLPMPST